MRGNAHTAKYVLRIFLQKRTPAGKCRHGNIFFAIFLTKKSPCGKMHTRPNDFFRFSSLPEHNGVLLEHNGVLLEHNGVFPEHNGVLPEQNAG